MLLQIVSVLLFYSASAALTVSSYVIGNITGYVGSQISFDAGRFFSDPQAILTFSIQGLPIGSGMSLDPRTGMLQGVPLAVDQARRTCIVHCVSSFGGSADGILYILIKPANRPPVVSRTLSTIDTSVYGGTPLSIYLSSYFVDPDIDDTLTFTVRGLPAGSGFSFNSQGLLSGTPTMADLAAQPLQLTIQVFDTAYASVSATLTINVQQGFRSPSCQTIPAVNGQMGDRLSVGLASYCQDPDGGSLSFSAIGLPVGSGLSVNASGFLTGIPVAIDRSRQPLALALVATNPRFLHTTASFMVSVAAANIPPVAAPLAPAQAIQGQSFTMDLRNRFTDADSDVLTFSLSGAPVGSGFKLNNGVLSGVPSWADCAATPQPLRFYITASDGHTNGNVTSLLMLSVQCANQPPVALPIQAPSRAEAGRRFLFRAASYFTSPDGDPLTYTIDVPSGSGFVIDSATGVLGGTPTNTDCWRPQPIQLGITARDNRGGSANAVLTIQVSCGVAQIRVAGLPPALTVTYGKYFEMNLANYVSTTGPFALVYATDSIPPNAAIFLSSQGLLAGTPGARECDSQFFSVDVRINDGHGASAVATVFVAVDCMGVPRPPGSPLPNIGGGPNGPRENPDPYNNQRPNGGVSTTLVGGVPVEVPGGVTIVAVPVPVGPMGMPPPSLWPTILMTREPTPAPPTPMPTYGGAVAWSWAPTSPTSRRPTMTAYPTAAPTPWPTFAPSSGPSSPPTKAPTFPPTIPPTPDLTVHYNDAEMSLGIPIFTLKSGEQAAINLVNLFDFPPSNALRYSLKGLNTNRLVLDSRTGVLSGTPSTSDCDNSPMGLVATASVSSRLSQSRILVVQVLCTEQDSWAIEDIVAFPIPDQVASEGFFMDFSQYFYYDGPESLSYNIEGLPVGSGFRFYGDGSLRGQPSDADCGAAQPLQLTISVDDGVGHEKSSHFGLTVDQCDDFVTLGSSGPVAASIPALTGKPNQLVFLDVSNYFSDPNGKTLTFRAVGLPVGSGLQLSPTGVLSGQPSQADLDATKNGPLTLQIIADDGHGRQTQTDLLFRMARDGSGDVSAGGKSTDPPSRPPPSSANLAPSIKPPSPNGLPSNFDITVGQQTAINISAYVNCGTDAAYFSNNLPADSGLTLDPVTGSLAGVPTDTSLKESPITVALVIYGDCSNSDYSITLTVRSSSSKPTPNPRVPLASTCEDLGWTFPASRTVCGYSRVANGDCSADVTYAEALQTCTTMNARLCTSAELSANAGAGTGCGLDQKRIWSSSPCSTKNGNGVFTQSGSSNNKDPAAGVLCSAKGERYPVRCCADSRARQRNSAPLMSRIPDISLDAGQAFSRELGRYFSDPDGDELGFTISGLSSSDQAWLKFDARTATMSGTPPSSAAGRPLNLVVTGDDGKGGSIDAAFTLTVRNKPSPNSNAIPSAEFFEGVPALVSVASYFQDAGSLTFSLSGLPARSGLRIDPNLGIISGTPNFNDVQASPMSLRIGAQDSVGQRVESILKLVVRPGKSVANHPPVSLGISDAQATVGVPFLTDLTARFQDPDQDSLVFSIQGLPLGSGLVLSSLGIFGGVPTQSDQAKSPLRLSVQASDRQGGTVESTFKLTVVVGARANNPPTLLRDLPLLQVSNGTVRLNTAQYFADKDQNPLRFSLVGLPQGSGISIDPTTGLITGAPSQADLGCRQPLLAGVVASDGQSQVGGLISILLGKPPPRNSSGKSASSCEQLGWMTVIPESGVCAQSYLATARDCPDRMSFSDAQITCGSSGARLCTVKEIQRNYAKNTGCALDSERVWASDECAGGHMSLAGAASSLDSVPSICTVNRQRQFMRCCADSSVLATTDMTPAQCLAAGEQSTLRTKVGVWSFFSVGASASDSNGLALQGLPPNSGMKFYPQSRAIAGIPVLDDALASPIVLVLSYPAAGRTQTSSYTLLVDSPTAPSSTSSSGLPTMTPLTSATALVGQLFTYDARPSCSDVDGNTLTFSLNGLPIQSGFRIIPSSGVIFGAPSIWDVSATQPLQVIVGCSNGKGQSNQTLAIQVSGPQTTTNAAPMAGSLPPITGRMGQYLTVDLSSGFWDPQGRRLTFTQTGLPAQSGLSLSKAGVLAGVPNANDQLASRTMPVVLTVVAEVDGTKAQSSVTISIDQGKTVAGPSATPTPAQTVTLGEPFFVDFSSQFRAPNRSDLTYQISGLPSESGLSFNSDLITLSGIPSDADIASEGPTLTPLSIVVTATDSQQQSASSAFSLLVVPNFPVQSSKACLTLGWNSTTPLLCATSNVPRINAAANGFDLTKTQCSGSVTFYQAVLQCQAMGGRLCTEDELADNAAKGTGCNLDSKMIWSSTPCKGRDGVLVRPGSSSGERKCSQRDAMFDVRCCADKKKVLIPPTVLPIFGVTADVGSSVAIELGRNFVGVGLTFEVDGLPDGTGLALDKKTGKLYGTPTTVDAAARQPLRLRITATDAAGNTAQGTLLLTIPGDSVVAQDKSHSAKTCAELGWNTSTSSNLCGNSAPTGRCQPPVSYAEADLICTRVGARLCTQKELTTDVASDTGCMLDQERTWSSTQCDTESPPDVSRRDFSNFQPSEDDDWYLLLALGGERRVFMDDPPGLIMTQSGGSKFLQQFPERCESTETLKYRVRCCADASLPGLKPQITGVKVLAAQTAAVLVPNAKFNLDMSTKFSSSRPLQYSISGLPNRPGLTLNAKTGILSGTPTNALLARAPLTLIVNATDTKGVSAQTKLSLTVRSNAPTSSPSPAPTKKASKPTMRPTRELTSNPTPSPTRRPTAKPTPEPTPVPQPTPPPTVNYSAPQTCTSLGWAVRQQMPTVCSESLVYRGECSPVVGVLAAQKMCAEKLGARLCTSAELRSGLAAGTACNNVNVWSGTSCAGGLIAITGLPDMPSEVCGNTQSLFSVVCCADVPPGGEFRDFVVDRSSGTTISWSWQQYPNVRVSYQKTTEPQGSWITPAGAERVPTSKFTFPPLATNTDYVVRLTPLRDGQPVSPQEVQLMFRTGP